MGAYLPALCVINLFLLISSTALLYLGSILINFYLLPSLNLVTEIFATVPYLIVSIGCLLLIFSIYGLVAAGSKSRIALVVYSILMGVVFVIQLASVFTSLELRNEMMARVLNTAPQEIFLEMENYWTDEDVKYKWDNLQRDFQCCGVIQHNTGYKDWQRVNNWGNARSTHGVPDSCCLKEQTDCGVGTGQGIFQDLYPGHSIFTHGCMTILEHRLERDIEPVLLTYIGCGVVLALVEILAMVLSAAYVAAISRKMRDDPRDRMGMYQHPSNPGSQYEDIKRPILMTNSETLDSGITLGTCTPLSVRRLEQSSSKRSSLHVEPSDESGTQI